MKKKPPINNCESALRVLKAVENIVEILKPFPRAMQEWILNSTESYLQALEETKN